MEVVRTIDKFLTAFDTLAPYLPYFFTDEVAFSFTDRVLSSNIRPDVKVGDTIPAGSADLEAISQKATITTLVPQEVYGFPLKCTSIPLIDEAGFVFGCLSAATNQKRENEVTSFAVMMSNAFQQISSSISQISSGVQYLVNDNQEILYNVGAAERKPRLLMK